MVKKHKKIGGSKLICKRNKKHRNNHKRSEFLISVADGKPLTCSKCKGKLIYVATQYYPNHKRVEKLILKKVKQIKATPRYLPFLLKLKNKKGESIYWLQYWVKVDGKLKYGQYAPLLNKQQMKEVHKSL